MEKTTVQLKKSTLERLKNFKRHERESYEEVVNYLMDESEEDLLSSKEIDDLKDALEDVKKGRVKSIEQVAAELGVKLR
ncbi:MAG TPA: hypothetical protein VJB90_06430 [Candidatus Nanoarchaeia archaeon]|nr:hypothetical protein [Candidatus Nanoarchaeia archaeon]